MTLFEKDKIINNFRTMNEVWQSSTMTKASNPHIYPRKAEINLPLDFTYLGTDVNT